MESDIELMGRTVLGLLVLDPCRRRAALEWIVAFMADCLDEPAIDFTVPEPHTKITHEVK